MSQVSQLPGLVQQVDALTRHILSFNETLQRIEERTVQRQTPSQGPWLPTVARFWSN